MGTDRRITLTGITPRTNLAAAVRRSVLDYCFLLDGVPVGYLRCEGSRNSPQRRGGFLFTPDVTRLLNDCVDIVGGDLTAGFLLRAASDVLRPHWFTLSVPARVRDRQRPYSLVANTDRLPLLTHHRTNL